MIKILIKKILSILMNSFEKKYFQTKRYHFYLALVLIGAINWGTTALGYNLVDSLKNVVNRILSMETYFDKIIYLVVAFAAIKLAMKRDVWLPFLGDAVLPGSLIPLKQNKGDTVVEVNVKPNTRVAYWASLPNGSEKTPDVITAYSDYSNAGVVLSDKNGVAKLNVVKGTGYTVPSGREIERHVHYRVIDQEWGMIGPVQTAFY